MEKLGYNITKEEYEKLYSWAENIYNSIVVIDYFCKNQKEIAELNNIVPIISNLKRDADLLSAFFINLK